MNVFFDCVLIALCPFLGHKALDKVAIMLPYKAT